MTKIFCIGFPKTGTMSLAHALQSLGYRASHYPINDIIPALEEGRWEAVAGSTYDAFCNCGEWQFAALDRACRGSRFIYTDRDEDAWLASLKRHLQDYPPPERGSAPYMNRLEVFSTATFDADVMRTAYRAHRTAVMEYFRGRADFLPMQVEDPLAFDMLCAFLGHPPTGQPFPAKNRAVDRQRP